MSFLSKVFSKINPFDNNKPAQPAPAPASAVIPIQNQPVPQSAITPVTPPAPPKTVVRITPPAPVKGQNVGTILQPAGSVGGASTGGGQAAQPAATINQPSNATQILQDAAKVDKVQNAAKAPLIYNPARVEDIQPAIGTDYYQPAATNPLPTAQKVGPVLYTPPDVQNPGLFDILREIPRSFGLFGKSSLGVGQDIKLGGELVHDFTQDLFRGAQSVNVYLAQRGLMPFSLDDQGRYVATNDFTRFVFGDKPIEDFNTSLGNFADKAAEKIGLNPQQSTIATPFLKSFGAIGSLANYDLGLEGIFKKVSEDLGISLTRKYGQEVAAEIIEKGGVKLAEKAVAEGGEKAVTKFLGREVETFAGTEAFNAAEAAGKTITRDEIIQRAAQADVHPVERNVLDQIARELPQDAKVPAEVLTEKIKTALVPLTRADVEVQADDIAKAVRDTSSTYAEHLYETPTPAITSAEGTGLSRFASVVTQDTADGTRRILAATNLSSYDKTWYERVLKEEIAKAAEEGKSVVQIPTGETAAKVVDESVPMKKGAAEAASTISATPRNTQVGQVINDGVQNYVVTKSTANELKAVPAEVWQQVQDAPNTAMNKARIALAERSVNIGREADNPVVRKFFDNEVASYLKTIRTDVEKVKDAAGNTWLQTRIAAEDAANPVRESVEQVAGQLSIDPNNLTKWQKLKTNAKAQFLDRYSPIADLVKMAKDKIGAGDNPYIAARNFAGHMGKIENRLNDLGAILRSVPKDTLKTAKEYAKLERFEELYNRGITTLEGGMSIDDVLARKAAIEQNLGSQGMARVNDVIGQIRQYSNNLLKEVKDAGVLSDSAYEAILANNEKYIPLQRVQYLDEQADNIPRGARTFNITQQSLVKSIKGSEKEVADPIESLIRNTYSAVSLAERNKVAQKVADLSKLDEFKDIIIPLRTAENVTQRIDVFSELKDSRVAIDRLNELMKTRGRWAKSVSQELDALNAEGVQAYLKRGAKEVPETPVAKVTVTITPEEVKSNIPARVRDLKLAPLTRAKLENEFGSMKELAYSLKENGYGVLTDLGLTERSAKAVVAQVFKDPTIIPRVVTATEEFATLSANETKKVINSLMEQSPEGIAAIRKKIATRDARLAGALNDLEEIKFARDAMVGRRGELKDAAQALRDLEVPPGMDKLSVFRDGVKEEYAVPQYIGEALKGMNEQNTDLMTRMARLSTSALRAGATSLNAAFIVPNIIRDYQTATLVSKVGFTPLDWLRGFASAIGKGEDYRAYLESGASFGGYFEGARSTAKTVAKLTENKAVSIGKTILNPFELIRTVGEVFELAPRIGVYKRSVRADLHLAEAAFNARNATVDFARSGTTMKVVNMWVPFLNARLQGTVNAFEAIKGKPLRSAMILSGMVGAPIVATYINNTKNFPDIWNDIAQFEKDANFIIIYGNGRDEQGNPTQVIKIPKGDVGRIFGNPLEAFLTHLDGKGGKGLEQLAMQVFSDISPVSFTDQNGAFSLNPIGSSILPPTAKGLIETAVNKNLYTGRDIVPQGDLRDASPYLQYDEKTTPFAKALGKFLNWSPMKIDNFIRTQFGGVGSQITNPGQAATSVSSRFFGARGGQGEQEDIKAINKLNRQEADKNVLMDRQAQDLLNQLNGMDKNAAADEIDKLYNDNQKLAEKVIELKFAELYDYSPSEKAMLKLGVDNGMRARFIATKLQQMPNDEARANYFQRLVDIKLMTPALAQQIAYLIGQNPQPQEKQKTFQDYFPFNDTTDETANSTPDQPDDSTTTNNFQQDQ